MASKREVELEVNLRLNQASLNDINLKLIDLTRRMSQVGPDVTRGPRGGVLSPKQLATNAGTYSSLEQEQNTLLAEYNRLAKIALDQQKIANRQNTEEANALHKKIEALRKLTTERRKLTEEEQKTVNSALNMHRPSSSIYEHRKLEEAKQNAQKLSAILHGNNTLTKEQLDRAGRMWGQFSQTVKKADQELYDAISAGFFKQKELLNAKLVAQKEFAVARQAIERQVLLNERANALELAKTKAERAKVEREWDAKALAADKAHNKARLDEDRRALREQRALAISQGRTQRGGLELGGGVTGRGLISGVAGLGGVNLYGLGILGAGAAGTRAALNAYADIFNTKNVLAGIVQTFSQFKDENGRSLGRSENFTQSQQYSNYLYGRLRKAAVDSPLTLKELSDVYTTGTPFLARSGVNFEQSIGITNTVASLGKMMGLRLDSIKDDIRAIYEGRFRNVQTFQAAGFTSDDFKKLSNMRGDDLVNFFNEKFSGYQQSLKQFAGSFTAQWDRLIDSLYQSAALVGEKIAPAFVNFATDLQDTLTKWAADGTLDRFSKDMGTLLSTVGVALANITTVLVTFGAGIGRIGGIISDAISNVLQTIGVTNGKVTAQELASYATRGIQTITGGAGDWNPEAKQLLTNLSGTGLSGDKKRGVLVNALDTLVNSNDPASILQNYTTIKHSIGGAIDVFSTIEKVQALQTTLPGKGTQDLSFLSGPRSAEVDSAMSNYMSQFSGLSSTAYWAKHNEMVQLRRTNPTKLYSMLGGFLKRNPQDIQDYKTWIQVKSGIDSINSATNSNYDYTSTEFPISQMKTITGFDFAKSGINISDLIGMGIAKDVLDKEGITTASLRVIAANPASAKAGAMKKRLAELMERERKKFAPNMTNTAPTKVPTPKRDKSLGSITPKRIEPSLTLELAEIENINQQKYQLEIRQARGEDVSGQMRALDYKLIDVEDRIAKKKANAEVAFTGGTSSGDARLNNVFQTKLQEFVAASGGKVRATKLYRSLDDQTRLWNKALKKYGSAEKASKWVARPGTSNHEFGLANDLEFGPGGVAWAHANAAKFGLGFPMAHENWHIELAEGSKNYRKANGLTYANMQTKSANAVAISDNRTDDRRRQLDLERIRYEEEKKRAAQQRAREVNLLNLQYNYRKDLSGTDATLQYAAKLKILNAQYPGLERLKPEYRNAKAELDAEKDAAIKAAQEQVMRENEATAAQTKSKQHAQFMTSFRNKEDLIGLYGSDLAKAKLAQDISSKEDMMSKGGIGGAWAATVLPALYEQRRALERNTEALNKQLSTKFNNAVKGIFSTPEFLSPSQTYRAAFDKKIEAIDNMSSTDLNKYRASLGLAGLGYNDEQLRGMLKLQATRGFSSQGYRSMQRRDQLFGGANAFLGALQSGGDPIAAFAGAYQNLDGQEAQQRLLQGLFNRGSYQRMELAGISKHGPVFRKGFDKGAFNRDLISGGGSLVANMLVGTMGGQAQMGSQLGGMLAPLLFTGLGAWAGPLGILGGGLIGSLFGKKKQQDPSIEQHRKRLEELLQSINNRLKPQEDFYRTIKGSVLWGSASRSFGGRASSLGARVALGVI